MNVYSKVDYPESGHTRDFHSKGSEDVPHNVLSDVIELFAQHGSSPVCDMHLIDDFLLGKFLQTCGRKKREERGIPFAG
uniref:Transposase n=1 Tax=Ascaris lumbricoides TaxID=6252 RepID=A0A0M3I5X0_ASCLU